MEAEGCQTMEARSWQECKPSPGELSGSREPGDDFEGLVYSSEAQRTGLAEGLGVRRDHQENFGTSIRSGA